MDIGSLAGLKKASQSVKPSSMFISSRRMGIELEYENITAHPSGILDTSLWEITEDGSLRILEDNSFSLELRFAAALGGHDAERAFASLRKFLSRNKKIQCTERTGLHVHVDFREMSVAHLRNFIINYLLVEPFLYEFCGDNRDKNIFCIPLYRSPHLIHSLIRQELYFSGASMYKNLARMYKYSGMNLLSLTKKGSVEFRMHKSTTDVDRIITWVNILLSLVEASVAPPINLRRYLRQLENGGTVINTIFGKYASQIKTINFEENLDTGRTSLYTFMCAPYKAKITEDIFRKERATSNEKSKLAEYSTGDVLSNGLSIPEIRMVDDPTRNEWLRATTSGSTGRNPFLTGGIYNELLAERESRVRLGIDNGGEDEPDNG